MLTQIIKRFIVLYLKSRLVLDPNQVDYISCIKQKQDNNNKIQL
jgi:hypothetical protein